MHSVCVGKIREMHEAETTHISPTYVARKYNVTHHINDNVICDMTQTLETLTSNVIDNVKGFFEKCTNDLQNPNVRDVMETFKRQGLREINFYGNRNRLVFTQLEPIMRQTRLSIEDLVRDKVVTENYTDILKANQCITDIYTCIFNEVHRGTWLPVQPPGMSTLLMKVKNCVHP